MFYNNDSDVQVGSIGLVIELTVKEKNEATGLYDIVDISSATVKNFYIKKPDKTIVIKTADFVTDGSDGKLKYVTIANDLDMRGLWYIQAYINSPGFNGRSTIIELFVNDNV